MASVWKHPNSQYWTACFTDREGKRCKRTTKERNQKKALKIAEQFEEASRTRRTFKQFRHVLETFHTQITGEEIKNASVRSHIANWLSEKMDETKVSTIETYRASMDKFMTFLRDKADRDIAELTRNDILAYRKDLTPKLSSTSTNQHLKAVKMLLRAAHKENLVSENVAEFVDTVKKKGGYERRPFTIAELKAVWNVADPEWKSMILFGLYTGQRLSDLASLRWDQIDLQAGELKLTTAKTGRLMQIPLAPPLLAHLYEAFKQKSDTERVHPSCFETLGKNYKSSTLSNRFGNLLFDASLRPKVSHKKEKEGRSGAKTSAQLSFHSLRHTAVTLLKEAGTPSAVVMELIGHDSAQMSQHYTHVGSEALAKAARSFPDITLTQ